MPTSVPRRHIPEISLPRPVPEPPPEALPPGLRPDDGAESRRLRIALVIAVVLHGLLFLLDIPDQKVAAEEPPQPQRMYLVNPMPKIREKQPEPPPEPREPPPEERVRSVPIPMPEVPEMVEPVERPVEIAPIEAPTVRLADLPPIAIPDAPPAPPADGPLEVGGAVSAPVKIQAPLPRYTELARRARIQGTVVVRATIDADGTVRDVEVIKGLPMGLTESAIAAVRQWTFEPARLNGRPVDVYFDLKVTFGLS